MLEMAITAMEAVALREYYTTKLVLIQEGFAKSVQWGGKFIEKSLVEQKGEKRGEWRAPGQEGMRVMFPPQIDDSLLVFLISFPHCLGKVVLDLLRFVGFGTLGVLGARLSPFARPSSPCSSGHS